MFLLYTARFIFYDYNLKVLGVIRTLIEVQEKIKSHPDLKKRYFLKPDEVILLADGTKIVVNNQWGTLFPRFLEAAKKLYQVTNDSESNTPISVSTQFRASPFERALFSALNRVLLIN